MDRGDSKMYILKFDDYGLSLEMLYGVISDMKIPTIKHNDKYIVNDVLYYGKRSIAIYKTKTKFVVRYYDGANAYLIKECIADIIRSHKHVIECTVQDLERIHVYQPPRPSYIGTSADKCRYCCFNVRGGCLLHRAGIYVSCWASASSPVLSYFVSESNFNKNDASDLRLSILLNKAHA